MRGRRKEREGGGESFLGQEPRPPLAKQTRKTILQMEGIKWEGEGPLVIARGGREMCVYVCVCARARVSGSERVRGEAETHQTRRK